MNRLHDQQEELNELREQSLKTQSLRFELEVSRMNHMSSLHSVYYVGSFCNHFVHAITFLVCRLRKRNLKQNKLSILSCTIYAIDSVSKEKN